VKPAVSIAIIHVLLFPVNLTHRLKDNLLLMKDVVHAILVAPLEIVLSTTEPPVIMKDIPPFLKEDPKVRETNEPAVNPKTALIPIKLRVCV
jgi:hypothetical protein